MKNPLFDSLVWGSLRLTTMNFALRLSGLVPPSAHPKTGFHQLSRCSTLISSFWSRQFFAESMEKMSPVHMVLFCNLIGTARARCRNSTADVTRLPPLRFLGERLGMRLMQPSHEKSYQRFCDTCCLSATRQLRQAGSLQSGILQSGMQIVFVHVGMDSLISRPSTSNLWLQLSSNPQIHCLPYMQSYTMMMQFHTLMQTCKLM